jgi:hypothetical protein
MEGEAMAKSWNTDGTVTVTITNTDYQEVLSALEMMASCYETSLLDSDYQSQRKHWRERIKSVKHAISAFE